MQQVQAVTPKRLTNEQAFQTVVRGLAGQGWKQSRTLRGKEDTVTRCAFRGDEGRKCAAGHLLTDESWRSAINTLGFKDAFKRGANFQGVEPSLGIKMQVLHDLNDLPSQMRTAYLELGTSTGWAWPEDVAQDGVL